MNNLLPYPPMGWNSFDCYGIFINEAQALANLEVFAAKLKPYGYEYFCIDGGWYSEYEFQFNPGAVINKHEAVNIIDDHGRLIASPRLFPRGLKHIANRCHELGIKFGIHIMRGIPRKAVEMNLPIINSEYRAGDIADTSDVCYWSKLMYGVDMHHPGAQAYYDSVIDYLADNGVDFIKADDILPFPDEIAAVKQAIDRCGRKMVLSLSPGGHISRSNLKIFGECADMVRLSGDVWDERKDIDRCFDRWELWQDVAMPGLWLDLDMIPFGALQVYADSASTADRNNLLSGKGSKRMCRLTPEQKRTFITMRALAASPLFMGGELTQTPDSDFELITQADILACCRNGVTGRQLSFSNYLDIRKTPERNNPDCGWIGIFNRFCTVKTLTVTPETLQIAPGSLLHSIWENREIKLSSTGFNLAIAADDVCFLRYQLN